MPYWAGTSAAIVCQPHLGASLRKGWFRMIGTVVGAVAIVVLTACFPQDRVAFLVGLALWGAACALVATLLRNFASYAAALAGYTAAIIASDQLGATGGPNGEVFMLAVTRVSEICIGIVCAGIVLAGTDFGGARRRLAALFAALSAEIASRFTGTLAQAGSELAETQPVRRELIRRVIALDPVIDEAIGESSRLRYHSPVLQAAVDGLFAALAGWRTVAVHLARLPTDAARQEADAVLQHVPRELRSAPDQGEPTRWMADPVRLRRLCDAAVRALIALPATRRRCDCSPTRRPEVLAGMSHALDGLALLVADPARARSRRRGVRLHVPDWLPSLVNAGRAFVTIGAVALFWIVTAWPNGALAMTLAAISVILFAPRADQAYACGHEFHGRHRARRRFRRDHRICGAAGDRDLRRLQHGDRALSGARRCSDGPTVADGDVCGHGRQLRPAARAREPDELRHCAILQRGAGDRRRHRRCGAFLSLAAAAVAGAADAPAPGPDACATCAASQRVLSRGRPMIGRAACMAGSRCCPTG